MAEALDSEGVFAHEVFEVFPVNCGALRVGAAPGYCGGLAFNWRFADRAGFGFGKWRGVWWAEWGDYLEDFGDDVARFLDDDGVANPHVFAFNFVKIMQGGAGD